MADDFASLMDRVAQGDEQAAAKLFHEYRDAILFVIRQRLKRHPQLRTIFDSTDFLQEVARAIFAHPEKLHDFDNFTDFIKYLAGVARNQVKKARQQHFGTQKREARRVCHLGDPSVAAAAEAIPDPRPDPAQRASTDDEWLRWLMSLRPHQRSIVLLLRTGLTHQEVAAKLGCSVRTIERQMALVRQASPPSEPLQYL